MKNIVIVGAGGFGREVFTWAKDCVLNGKDWSIKGFIDDNLNALDGYSYPVKVIEKISDYKPDLNDEFLLALGSPESKKKVVRLLESRGAKFATLIHPSAIIGTNIKIGKGCIICPFDVLTNDVLLGDFVSSNIYVSIGHDAKIASWTTISSHCDITGFVEIGESVFVASSVAFAPSSKVEANAKIGINSSVIGKIREGRCVFGNPAVKI